LPAPGGLALLPLAFAFLAAAVLLGTTLAALFLRGPQARQLPAASNDDDAP
jgi:hypothetical protein